MLNTRDGFLGELILTLFKFAQWYGKPHAAVELQREAVYGLSEVHTIESIFHFIIKLLNILSMLSCNKNVNELIIQHSISKQHSTSDVCIAERIRNLIHVQLNRGAIKGARLIANPGCYPTAAQLPLIPLLKAGFIKAEDIIIDAKSGEPLFLFY